MNKQRAKLCKINLIFEIVMCWKSNLVSYDYFKFTIQFIDTKNH